MGYVEDVQLIGALFQNAGPEVEARLQRCNPEIIAKVSLLRTMLENAEKSTNSRLKADLRSHQIPEKLRDLVEFLTVKHRHDWVDIGVAYNVYVRRPGGAQRETYPLFECVEHESLWNDNVEKAGHVIQGLFLGIFSFGILANTTIGTCVNAHKIDSHSREISRKLSWLVKEIEAIYNQTNALFLAHLV